MEPNKNGNKETSGLPDPSTRPTGPRPPFSTGTAARVPQLQRRNVSCSDLADDDKAGGTNPTASRPNPEPINSGASRNGRAVRPARPKMLVSSDEDDYRRHVPDESSDSDDTDINSFLGNDEDLYISLDPPIKRLRTVAQDWDRPARRAARRAAKRAAKEAAAAESEKNSQRKRRAETTDESDEEEIYNLPTPYYKRQPPSAAKPKADGGKSSAKKNSAKTTPKSQEGSDGWVIGRRERIGSSLFFHWEFGLRLLVLKGNTQWSIDRRNPVFGQKKYYDTVHTFPKAIFSFIMGTNTNIQEEIEKNRLENKEVLAEFKLIAYVLDETDQERYPVELIQICRHHSERQARIVWPVTMLSEEEAEESHAQESVEYIDVDEDLKEKFEKEQERKKCEELEEKLKQYAEMEEKMEKFAEMEKKLEKFEEMQEDFEKMKKKYQQSERDLSLVKEEVIENEKSFQKYFEKWTVAKNELKRVTGERDELRRQRKRSEERIAHFSTEMMKKVTDLKEDIGGQITRSMENLRKDLLQGLNSAPPSH